MSDAVRREKRAAYMRDYYQRPGVKERVRARVKRYAEANRELVRAQQREYNLRQKYGISAEQKEEMFRAQGSSCAICGGAETDSGSRKVGWHVDHCHETGRVRGILCGNCNRMLGSARDSVKTLRQAISYLRKP